MEAEVSEDARYLIEEPNHTMSDEALVPRQPAALDQVLRRFVAHPEPDQLRLLALRVFAETGSWSTLSWFNLKHDGLLDSRCRTVDLPPWIGDAMLAMMDGGFNHE